MSEETIQNAQPEVQDSPQMQEAPVQPLKKLVWWKDLKLLFGFILVLLSIILGFFGKGLIVINIAEPFHLIRALSIYAFSWILLFIGIFLVGMETVKMIRQRINHHVKRTVIGTYEYTSKLPKRGITYTKQLHEKSLGRLMRKPKSEKKIVEGQNV